MVCLIMDLITVLGVIIDVSPVLTQKKIVQAVLLIVMTISQIVHAQMDKQKIPMKLVNNVLITV